MSSGDVRIVFSPKARYDIEMILASTELRWGVEQRGRYAKQLDRTLELIKEHPTVGISREDLGAGVRTRLADQHVIFYRIVAPNIIRVLRVLHGSMDLTRWRTIEWSNR